MLSPTAQCQAGPGRNFQRKLLQEETKQQSAVSAIYKTRKAWSKGRQGNDNNYIMICAGCTDFWTFNWNKVEHSHPCTFFLLESNFWIALLCIFTEPVSSELFSCMQSSLWPYVKRTVTHISGVCPCTIYCICIGARTHSFAMYYVCHQSSSLST